jgi:predicted GIY-YIG superfamily endonuclease
LGRLDTKNINNSSIPKSFGKREKQIKAGSRKKKEALIATIKPDWVDLRDEIKQW